MDDPYLDIAKLIERLHRRFLDVVRAELNQLGYRDLTPVQAMLLTNIGTEEIVIRELIERGYYQGSNVSYNMKKTGRGRLYRAIALAPRQTFGAHQADRKIARHLRKN